MAKLLKRKSYENRQAKYTDQYTIMFQEEGDGSISLWAEERPADPFGNCDAAHVRIGEKRICITPGKEPRSFERAEAIAHAWMLVYSEYVRTGKERRGTIRVDV